MFDELSSAMTTLVPICEGLLTKQRYEVSVLTDTSRILQIFHSMSSIMKSYMALKSGTDQHVFEGKSLTQKASELVTLLRAQLASDTTVHH